MKSKGFLVAGTIFLWCFVISGQVFGAGFTYIEDFNYPDANTPAGYLHNQNPTDWFWFSDAEPNSIPAYTYNYFADNNSVDRNVGISFASVPNRTAWYRWDKSAFQAQEGYKYTISVTALGYNDHPTHRETFWLDFGFGIKPGGNPNTYANWGLFCGVENDPLNWGVIGQTSGNPVGAVFSPVPDVNMTAPSRKPYEVELTVYSLAGQPDLLTVRARPEGQTSWSYIIENYPLATDLATGAADNYVLAGWQYAVTSQGPTYYYNQAVYDKISLKAEEIFPDFDVDGDVDLEDAAVFVGRWLNSYDFVDYANMADSYTGEQEPVISYFASEKFNFTENTHLQDKGTPDPLDPSHGAYFWHLWYGNESAKKYAWFKTYPADMNDNYAFPPGSEDGWFGAPRWSDNNNHPAYSWEAGGFQAVEGMEYILDATVASSRTEYIGTNNWPAHDPNDEGGYHEPNLFARPVTGNGIIADVAIGIRPNINYPDWGYDDYLYYTHVAGICNDDSKVGLQGYTAETLNLGSQGSEDLVKALFGAPFEASSWNWYDVRLIVRSNPNEPDTADFYARQAGVGEYVPIGQDVPLNNDLDTTGVNNYPLLVLEHTYDGSSVGGLSRNWNDYGFVDTLRMGVRPISSSKFFNQWYEDFDSGTSPLSLGAGSDWDVLMVGGSEKYAEFRSGQHNMPIVAEDGWVANPNSVAYGENATPTYAWNARAFQAKEGYEYSIESKVMAHTFVPYGGYQRGFRAQLYMAKAPDVNDPNEWNNYTKVAGLTDCASNWNKISVWVGDSEIPHWFRPDGINNENMVQDIWYEMKVVVRSIAGGADKADYYLKRTATDADWVLISSNNTLPVDLDTAAATNVPVIRMFIWYTSGTFDWTWSWVDHVTIIEREL